MPETKIQDMTDGGDPQANDLLNIQRFENGIWLNYAISVGNLIGGNLIVKDLEVQDLDSGGTVQLLPAPTAGMLYLIKDIWMMYTPGTQFDGGKFDIELTDSLTSVVYGFASFNLSPTAAGSPLIPPTSVNTPSPGGPLVITMSGTTAADGDFRVWAIYEEVFI
jgi:hypothetical protein